MQNGVGPASECEGVAVAQSLSTNIRTGLASGEARRRLQEYGPNKLREAAPPSNLLRLMKQFRDPLVYLLLAAAAVLIAVWLVEGDGPVPIDAVVIGMIVLVNAALGYVQERQAADAVAALAKMTAVTSAVLRDGTRQRVPSEQLVPGDVLILEEGDSVGADGRLVEASALRVQEASLTGESEPVSKDTAVRAAGAPIAEQSGMIFKGTAIVQGTGLAVVTATGMRTQIGAIAHLLETTEESPSPLQREVGRIGRTLGVSVLIIAAIVVATTLAITDIRSASDLVTVLLLGVSLAVAAVPEGLPAVLSLVLALGMRRMAARNAIMKDLSSVETLGAATVICTDKTGTLTRAEMMIERIATASGTTRFTGSGYVPVGSVETVGGEAVGGPLRAEQIVALSGGSLANNASLLQAADGSWHVEGDPTEAAFLVAERKFGTDERRRQRFERIGEVAFSSDRKMMSTLELDHEHADMPILVVKGAPDVLMARCTWQRVGMELLPFDEERRRQAKASIEAMSGDALRTLGVAYRPLHEHELAQIDEALERDLIFAGVVGMMDPPRQEAAAAIAEAHRAGIQLIMITGDHPGTAARIAEHVGIRAGGVLTGTDLETMHDSELTSAVRDVSIFARVAPIHKLRIVSALKANGHVVAMTGDGVNDAPALKAADIGIAMGITGTEVAKQAARMILADDNFATIVRAVREGRNIFDNIRKFLRYLLSSNMGEVLTIFLGIVLAAVIGLDIAGDGLVPPLLATQILWINLITDSGPALAMGVDPDTDGVMTRRPREPSEPIIDAAMWRGVIATGLVMAIATLATIDFYLPGGLMEGGRSLDEARTAGFTVLVFAQLFNCLNARSTDRTAFRNLFANRWLWGAIGLSVVLQVAVVQLPILNSAFGTVPLEPSQWLFCVLMSSTILCFGELGKLLRRRRH